MRILIDSNSSDQRLDRFLRKYRKPNREITLSDIYSRIRKGSIKVNGRKSAQESRLKDGDIIERDDKISVEHEVGTLVQAKSFKIQSFPKEKILKMIIAEDKDRIFWNKPSNLVMHPGNGHSNDLTLHDIMMSYLNQTGQNNASETFTPSFCFRLDQDTSGLVISAKSYAALQHLNELIRLREVSKTYLAIVAGQAPNYKKIDAPLFKGFDKNGGRAKTFINEAKWVEALTEVENIETIKHPTLGTISLVKVTIHTGRMHQIRVHCASIGLPVIGDLEYGVPSINRYAKKMNINRQLLHSFTYAFKNLDGKTISQTAEVPHEFRVLFPSAKSLTI